MSEVIALFTRASKLLRGAADRAVSQHGVRLGQNLVLEVLWESDGLTPGEVAQRLHVSTPAMVQAATRMEAAGLLTRRRDPDDARLVRLYLTEHARSIREPMQAARAELHRRATARLSPDELRHLRSALTKIIQEFAEDPPDEDHAAEDSQG
ncbi:MarR family transcriptional regulator [Micromonospora sp. CPCC 205371]|nr:MarR family transcriptional regulator [Micromonospora sp. CPCC 205371]